MRFFIPVQDTGDYTWSINSKNNCVLFHNGKYIIDIPARNVGFRLARIETLFWAIAMSADLDKETYEQCLADAYEVRHARD